MVPTGLTTTRWSWKQGQCTNSNAYGDNACGSLQTDLTLQPGESRELLVLLGIGEAAHDRQKNRWPNLARSERAAAELQKLKDNWHAKLGSLMVETPDEDLNHTVNVWGLYNCLITFAWSRAASLVYNGERDGLGFRDSVQDLLGVAAAIPEEARQRLELMLTGQVSSGGAMPDRPALRRTIPARKKPPLREEYRSDDCLWFFNAVPAYVNETGDLDFYNKVLPYADQGEATVLGHLRRALEFNLERTGKHGLPCGLAADWNDCLKLGYHGESLFVAFQVRLGLTVYAEIAERLGKPEEAAWALAQREKLDAAIQACAWDGDWFIWAIGEDGTVYGTKEYAEGQVYLNTQVWSVISGAATPEQAAALHADGPGAAGHALRADAVRAAVCQDADRRDAGGGLQPGHQGERRHLQPHPGLGRDGRVPAGQRRPGLRVLPGLHAGRLQRARRGAPERAVRAGPDHLFDLLPARRQHPHLLADRRGRLGVLQRHPVHPGHAARAGRPAHRPVHPA